MSEPLSMFLSDQELFELTGYHKPTEQQKFLDTLNIKSVITKSKNNKRCVVLRNNVLEFFGMRLNNHATTQATTPPPKMRLP